MKRSKQLLFFPRKPGITYLLRDDFTGTLAAGAVNGTLATPGPGVRDVPADSGNAFSIASGRLICTGSIGASDPRIFLRSVSRSPGNIFLAVTRTGSNTGIANGIFGWRASNTGFPSEAIYFSPGALLIAIVGGVNKSVGAWTANTDYNIWVVARLAGELFFVSGGNYIYPTLIFISNTDSFTPMLAGASAGPSGATLDTDTIRVSPVLWLPTPLASDGFGSSFGTTDGLGHAEGVAGGIGSGGGGLAWTGSTWSMSGGKAINTPGVGSELLTNTEFASDTTGWAAINLAILTRRDFASSPDIDPTGGGDNFGLEVMSGGNSTGAGSQPTTTVGNWFAASVRAYAPSTNAVVNAAMLAFASSTAINQGVTAEDEWQSIIATGRATGTSEVRLRINSSTPTDVAYFDAPSVKALALTDLFASCVLSTADVLADVALTIVSGTQAGLVLNLDSTSSPANFVIAYHDGTNCKLEKCVAGTYTTVISAVATYSANAVLRVAKIGAAYRLYYNNALVGSGTISDAGIISNTLHGLFSTYSGNTLDNFVVYASGSGGEYSNLNQYT